MRITGGQAKGIPLKVNKRSNLRPATDFLRESVFSSLGPLVSSITFLDLFAGTGAYGLEALSRGAQGGLFVEKDRQSASIITENLRAVAKSIGIESGCCQIQAADVFKTKAPSEQAYDIIFVDPPYGLYDTHLDKLRSVPLPWLKSASTSRVIVEAPGEMEGLRLEGLKMIKRLGKNNKGPCILIYALVD